jgi:molybdopterin molybdotransferase
MIRFEEAQHIVLSLPVDVSRIEEIPFTQALFRFVAKDIVADRDMPPFDKSAVDGYACQKKDFGKPLKILDVVAAGDSSNVIVEPGTCVKIMTGAPIPQGADMVIMKEDVEEKDGWIYPKKTSSNINIAYQGEDIRKGEIIIPKGRFLQAQHIGILAATGHTTIEVFQQKKVGIVATGNEIVEPPFHPNKAQIRNSNSYALMAQIITAGGNPHYYGIVPDDAQQLLDVIGKAAEENDLVFITGGVSEGDYDLVPTVMEKLGYTILFDQLAVQPGRPTTLAQKEKKYLFGMPGNPVSTFVQFHLLGKLLLWRMMGWHGVPCVILSRMVKGIKRKKSDRTSFYPVRFNNNGEVEPIPYNGSGHFYALADARGIVALEINQTELKEGEYVLVRLF